MLYIYLDVPDNNIPYRFHNNHQLAPGKPGSAMASLSKAGVAGTSSVQVVLKDSPVFLAQVFIFPFVLCSR